MVVVVRKPVIRRKARRGVRVGRWEEWNEDRKTKQVGGRERERKRDNEKTISAKDDVIRRGRVITENGR